VLRFVTTGPSLVGVPFRDIRDEFSADAPST
jgi:hypothetical protein